MIKCVILDDELLAISYLKLLCEQIEEIEIVKAYNDPKKFLSEQQDLDFDAAFLDIEMPGMTGLQVAEKISDKKIIFTTAYKEYAAEAFDLNVVDYIRKPIKKERLLQAIEKLKPLISTSNKKDFMEWNTSLGKTIVFTNEISFIKISEIDSRDKEVLLRDSSVILLKNMNFKTLLELLPKNMFVQINKKEVIALECIKAFSGNEIITTIPDLKLNVSDVYKDGLLKKIKG